MNIKQNNFKLSFGIFGIIALLLSGCSGSSNCLTNTNGGDNNNPLNVNLQLDYIGTVPVLNGAPTSSYFYIHNDGNTTISGINYTLADEVVNSTTNKNVLANSNDVIDGNGFVLKADSLSKCSTIAAHSYCQIDFTAPSLSLGNQNNSLLKVMVKDANGFDHAFDQVINYSYYNTALNGGVNFATSADVVANISNKRYMMSYLVGGGTGQSFSNVNLQISDSGALQINQGFVNGQSMASAEVIPVEFNVNILSSLPTPASVNPQYAVLTAPLSQKQNDTAPALQATQVASGQSLYVNASNQTSSAMALKLGVVPIIPAPSNATNAPIVYVSNFGDSVSDFTVEPASSNVVVYANNCTGTVESNASCSFKLGVTGSASGNSDVLFKVKGATVFSKVVYYAPLTPSGDSAIIISNTPITQIGLQPNQSSSVINFTFSNLGNYLLTNLTFTPKNSTGGSSQLKIISNSCDPRIESQTQCVIQAQVIAGSNVETGGLYLEISGNSGSTSFISQSGLINYYVTANNNLIISSPQGAESTLSIMGNNLESAQTLFKLNNNGNSPTQISRVALTGINIPAALSIVGNTCGTSIAAGSNCQIAIKFGPLQPESNVSGIANLQITYGESSNTLTGTINYSVTALDSHLAITNVASSGFSGSGTLADPYHGSGCNNNNLTMTITYKNMSDNYVAQNMALNIIDGHLSPYMNVESTATTCGYGANPKNLGIGQSCNLVLTANRSSMIDNSSFNLDVTYPSAIWNTTLGFVDQTNFMYSGSNKLYANYTQPVLTSTITPVFDTGLTRTLNQSLVGAEECGALVTNISAIPNVTSATVITGNCTVNSDLSISCTNSTAQPSNSISYSIDPNIPRPATLFTKFSLQNTGIQIWYNPSILMFTVSSLAP